MKLNEDEKDDQDDPEPAANKERERGVFMVSLKQIIIISWLV